MTVEHAEIEELYAAFQAYRLRPVIEGCPHCELEAAESSLHARPVREMTWKDLGVFPFKAMTTFGDVHDFKHFLPRMLELHALAPTEARYDLHVLVGKLDYGGWLSWPERELAAVRAMLRLLRQQLAASATEQSTDEWLLQDLERALSEHDPEWPYDA